MGDTFQRRMSLLEALPTRMKKKVYEECRKLFSEARLLPSTQWPAFIQKKCQDDPELAASLSGLLAAIRNPDPLSPLNLDQTSRDVPKRIGPWEVMDEIGKGGCGIVYRARRAGAPKGGIVALKVLRAERLNSDAVLRFLQEPSY